MDIVELFKGDDDLYTEIIKDHLQERKIILNEEVNDGIIENVCLMIMKWNEEDKYIPASNRKPIFIYTILMEETYYLAIKCLVLLLLLKLQFIQWDLQNAPLWDVIFLLPDINVFVLKIQ